MKTHLYGLSVVNYFRTGLQFQSDRVREGREREGECHANVFCVLNSQFSAYCAEPALFVCGVEWSGDGAWLPHRYHKIFSYFSYLVSVLLLANLACVLPEIGFWPSCNGQCSCRHQLTIFLASFSVYEPGPKPQSHTHTPQQALPLLCYRYRIPLNSRRYWLSLVQYSTSPLAVAVAVAVRLLLPAWSQWVIRRPYR